MRKISFWLRTLIWGPVFVFVTSISNKGSPESAQIHWSLCCLHIKVSWMFINPQTKTRYLVPLDTTAWAFIRGICPYAKVPNSCVVAHINLVCNNYNTTTPQVVYDSEARYIPKSISRSITVRSTDKLVPK